jgi:lipopolysaccharide/colanic/teichoic acid biosynthesis glycosyltransferase/GGDEF domain-containing protein
VAINRRSVSSFKSSRKIHHLEYINGRIKEEKLRVDRSGKSFSLLIIDFHHFLNARGVWKFLNGQLAKKVSIIILKSTRGTDIKGWHGLDRIVILLPETTKKGANVLLERMQEQLENELGTFLTFKDLIKDKILLTSSTYPDCVEASMQKEDQKEDDPLFMKSKITEYLNYKTYSKKNGNNFLKWKWGLFTLRSNHETLELSCICTPLINLENLKISFFKMIKRLLDIFGSIIALTLILPLMVLTAVLTKMTSTGPILFRQERMGYLGKRFTFFKFRSMYENIDRTIHENYMTQFINGHCEDNSQGENAPIYKLRDDPRMTPFGRFIRKTSIDELPQLFNVLKGDMSLVGPRPPIPYEVENYKLWHKKRVLEVKPGITGLWQVSGRSSTTFEDMVRLDLYYVNNWSLKMDLIILIKTIKALLSMKGAY